MMENLRVEYLHLYIPLPQLSGGVLCLNVSTVQYSTVQYSTAVASVQTTHRMDAGPHQARPRLLLLASARGLLPAAL